MKFDEANDLFFCSACGIVDRVCAVKRKAPCFSITAGPTGYRLALGKYYYRERHNILFNSEDYNDMCILTIRVIGAVLRPCLQTRVKTRPVVGYYSFRAHYNTSQ